MFFLRLPNCDGKKQSPAKYAIVTCKKHCRAVELKMDKRTNMPKIVLYAVMGPKLKACTALIEGYIEKEYIIVGQ